LFFLGFLGLGHQPGEPGELKRPSNLWVFFVFFGFFGFLGLGHQPEEPGELKRHPAFFLVIFCWRGGVDITKLLHRLFIINGDSIQTAEIDSIYTSKIDSI